MRLQGLELRMNEKTCLPENFRVRPLKRVMKGTLKDRSWTGSRPADDSVWVPTGFDEKDVSDRRRQGLLGKVAVRGRQGAEEEVLWAHLESPLKDVVVLFQNFYAT
jgi:hypothetical protein